MPLHNNSTYTCGECAKFKIPDAGCDDYESIRQGIILSSDLACSDFEPKSKTKRKEKSKPHKASGLAEEGYFEAVYHKGKPAFLVANQNTYSTRGTVTINDESYEPKEWPNEFPYEPYGVYEGAVSDYEELFWKVRDEFDLFLDIDSVWKDFLAACVLLTYQQEKIRTVPYPYFLGDNESGKTVGLNLLNWLCYRPLFGVTIPPADIYGYLDDSDAPGTILEDEVQGLHKDMDKAKIYKAGYKQGAVVPRTMITQNRRFIKYFRVFCFKVCAAEEMPRVKGLIERFIFIPMVEGYPRKDWADFDKEDEKRLRNLRNMLLKWRLATREREVPEVSLPVKGRLKEIWKPIIQIVHGLTVEEALRAHLEHLQKERMNEKTNALEGRVVKAVCELYVSGKPLAFSDIWDRLVCDLEGKLDDKKPHKMDTPEFGEVTKQKIGYRLREVLGCKKLRLRGPEGPYWAYNFDEAKLKRIAKKYSCDSVLKFSSDSIFTGVPAEEMPAKVLENNVNSIDKYMEKAGSTLLEVGSVENSRTSISLEGLASQTKELTRLATDFGIETCVLCNGKGHVDWQVTLFDESWGLLCGPCGTQLSKRLNNHD